MQWRVRAVASVPPAEGLQDVHPVLQQLLLQRGIGDSDALRAFLHPQFTQDLVDPFRFRDMLRAVERISSAIDRKEKIVVYGDYDADGVCGSVLLVDVLEQFGASVEAYLPHREREGYGLHAHAIEQFAQSGVQLIITVDCGSSNVDEIALATKHGMHVIVTDHHQQPPVLPEPYAFLNPAFPDEPYPFPNLCGTGVAYKLALALKTARDHDLHPEEEKWWLDLVAIGTVADMVPMVGENRTLVHYGLKVLGRTRRPGLRALLRSLNGRTLGTDTIAFQIAPRINAAGRLDHAKVAYDLLRTTTTEEAEVLVGTLDSLNKERQKITERMVREARDQIDPLPTDQRFIFAYHEDWLPGVIGIVAGQLARRYYRPAVVMARYDGNVVGSGRSIPGFNIVQAMHRVAGHLERYGGHPQACGFTLRSADDRNAFEKKLHGVAQQQLTDELLEPVLDIDAEVDLDDVDLSFAEQVGSLAPFGTDMPQPIFASRGSEVTDARTIGKNDRHLTLFVRTSSGAMRRFIGFGFGKHADTLSKGNRVDLAYTVEVNHWNGNSEPQLSITDIQGKDTQDG